MALYDNMPQRIVVFATKVVIIEVQRSKLNNIKYLHIVIDCKLLEII